MLYLILFILLILSILLAFWSLSKQKKLKEMEFVTKELKKKRVIYDHSSSSEESAP
jgi:hypothetical protein